MSEPEGRSGDDDHGISGASHGGPTGTAVAATGRKRGRGMGPEGADSPGGAGARAQTPEGQAADVQQPPSLGLLSRERSPLYQAQHAPRYQRQQLIRDYQAAHGCRLIVMIGPIFGYSVEYFEELLYDASPAENLHLMLVSPGGNGEIAVRLVRAAQARCAGMTVIVPDYAKSAATLLALGAHEILMGPTSDLGPVDPQFPLGDFDLVSAKDMIGGSRARARRCRTAPRHLPAARLASRRRRRTQGGTGTLCPRADRRSRPGGALQQPATKQRRGKQPCPPAPRALIEAPKEHAAIFSARYAKELGLPVTICDPASDQWKCIWRLWMHYYALGPAQIYENEFVSQVHRQDDDD